MAGMNVDSELNRSRIGPVDVIIITCLCLDAFTLSGFLACYLLEVPACRFPFPFPVPARDWDPSTSVPIYVIHLHSSLRWHRSGPGNVPHLSQLFLIAMNVPGLVSSRLVSVRLARFMRACFMRACLLACLRSALLL